MKMVTRYKSDYTCPVSRRKFLEFGISSTAAFCFGKESAEGREVSGSRGVFDLPVEARFYDKLSEKLVQCRVCPRECVIKDGDRGFCGTRENRKGTLISLVYGRVAAFGVDPIEKKPFFHVMPGSLAFSIATAGCNMTCKFCQNFHLSQSKPENVRSVTMSPQRVADEAHRSKSKLIAYTYNEPTVFTEYAYDCSRAGLDVGVHSVVVSNTGNVPRAFIPCCLKCSKCLYVMAEKEITKPYISVREPWDSGRKK